MALRTGSVVMNLGISKVSGTLDLMAGPLSSIGWLLSCQGSFQRASHFSYMYINLSSCLLSIPSRCIYSLTTFDFIHDCWYNMVGSESNADLPV